MNKYLKALTLECDTRLDLVIGIDTGDKTGFAVKCLTTGKYLYVKTLKRWQAQLFILHLNQHHNIFVVFEDARQRTWFGNYEKKLYNRIRAALFHKGITADERDFSTYKAKVKMSGHVKGDCSNLEQLLEDNGINFKAQAPKSASTKLPDKLVKKITGYTGRTSEHARDAMLIVHGYNKRNVAMYVKRKNTLLSKQ